MRLNRKTSNKTQLYISIHIQSLHHIKQITTTIRHKEATTISETEHLRAIHKVITNPASDRILRRIGASAPAEINPATPSKHSKTLITGSPRGRNWTGRP